MPLMDLDALHREGGAVYLLAGRYDHTADYLFNSEYDQ